MAPSYQSDPVLLKKAIKLLETLIATPSFSCEEEKSADLIETFWQQNEIPSKRKGNNVWVKNLHFAPEKPTFLLSSRQDTVRPNAGFILDPFMPLHNDGKLYGLGSNDAGGALVSLMATFLHFYKREDLPFNLLMLATAEEEISGKGGLKMISQELPLPSCGIVGEPTNMQMATAEKGLLVIDCIYRGKAAHAAREGGSNAIYQALEDLKWFRDYRFPKVSKLLGPVKMTVTAIHSGGQHNVVPDTCKVLLDIRVNDRYTHEQILETLETHTSGEIRPRSVRLRTSTLSEKHPLVQIGNNLGLSSYGSPTLSDQALMPFPTVKAGPGDPMRSLTPDEFIYLTEIDSGIHTYIEWLQQFFDAQSHEDLG